MAGRGWWFGGWVVAAIGCGGDEKSVAGDVAVAPEVLDFGVVGVDGEATLSITLTHSGDAPVDLLSVTLTQGDADVWRVNRNGVESLADGAVAELLVTFSPEEVQLYAGEVQIRLDGAAENSRFVTVRGSGGPSEADEDGDGFSIADGDCDDGDAGINPGADEVCNGRDDDCDGDVPGDETDADYDGFRLCDEDCDDADGNVYPGALEICDDKDSDCDGTNNDRGDADGDGFAVCDGDCDDAEAGAAPDRAEVCDDGIDNDCDGVIDVIDADADGHSACGDAPDCDDDDAGAFPLVVSPYGTSYGLGTPDDPLDDVAAAMAAVGACDVVYLDAGTYELSATWTGGALTLEGMTGSAPDVVLTAPKGSRHLTITGGEVTLRDLTLTGGAASDDGGSISAANADLVLSRAHFVGNTSANDGGAVAVSSGTLSLQRDCVFDGNTAEDDGGALLLDAAELVDTGETTYIGNVGKKGGAIYLVGGSAILRDALFVDNVATVEGGALAATGTPDPFVVERNRFAGNEAVADGGALLFRDFRAPDGVVRNNRVQDNVAGGVGGGLGFVGSEAALQVHNNTLTGNAATGEGGGIAVDPTGDASRVDLQNNLLHSNDGASALYAAAGSGAACAYTTVFGTASGVHFGGALGDGGGQPTEITNRVRNPVFTAFTDNGDPDDDDLSLGGASPEINDGNPDPSFDDPDGSRNDRGYLGGPESI